MSSQTVKQHSDVVSGISRYNRVMLIDDNSLDNFINKKLIETTGFASEVIICNSAEEALDHFRTSGLNQIPDVIFLDIMMPGMDGFQFLDEFANLSETIHKSCKVIMLSTSESFKDLNRANKNRFIRKFLNKPLTAQVLNAVKV